MIFENEEARIPTMREVFTPMIVIYILAVAFCFFSYKISVADTHMGFITWIGYFNDLSPLIFTAVLVILFPMLITIFKFKERKDKIIKRQTTNQLLYINISQGSIYFSFNKRELNFDCSYSDVKDMTMIIKTTCSKSSSSRRRLYRPYGGIGGGGNGFSISLHSGAHTSVTTRGTNYYISKLNVNIELNNGKKYSIELKIPAIEYKILYDFVGCAKGIENFSYKYTGAGEICSVTKKIDKILSRGS